MSDFTTGITSFEVPNPNGEPVLGRITVFASGVMVLAQEDLEDISRINTVILNKQAVETALYMLNSTPTTYQAHPPKRPKLTNAFDAAYIRISKTLMNFYKRLGVV